MESFKLTRKRFQNWTLQNIPKFKIVGVYFARVLKCYDGDTVTVCLFLRDFDPTPIQISCRMLGYDTPETRGSKSPSEKSEGKRCAQVISSLILGKFVLVEFLDADDKFGRGLTNIYVAKNDDTEEVCKYVVPKTSDVNPTDKIENLFSVNVFMIENTMCSAYNGGTKLTFEEMRHRFHKRCREKQIQCKCLKCEPEL